MGLVVAAAQEAERQEAAGAGPLATEQTKPLVQLGAASMSFMSLGRGSARPARLASHSSSADKRRPARRRSLHLERLEDRQLLTVVQFDTNLGSYRVALEDTAKPITVTNFLNYVNNDRYVDSFIHRVAHIPGVDVVQGGGFRFLNPGGVAAVEKDAAIQNEPGLSNVRGTIAMAKTSDPNSATSEWFINVLDNSVALDNPLNSGGFTVFGHVVGNGMTVVDAIAALQRVNLGSPFSELPVVNYSEGIVNGTHLVYTAVHVVDDVAPNIAAIANQTARQGLTLALNVPVADGDLPREQFQFTLVSGPAGSSFQSVNATTGRFMWSPPVNTLPGQYQATVRVTDLSGKTADQTINLTLADDAPTARIDDVPLTGAGFNLSTLTLRFNEAVSGFDIGDLQFTRNGGPNLLTGAQTLNSNDNAVFTLGNLASLTTDPGAYTLRLQGTNANIRDNTNRLFAGDVAKSWSNLGQVTQSLLESQAVTAEGTIHRIVADRTGVLTAEFSLDPAQGNVTNFRLIDSTVGTTRDANIAPDGSNGRIDYRVTAGRTYQLVVQGNHSNAAVRVTNLLELDDATKTATMHGLPGNDSMVYRIDAENLLFDFDGANGNLGYFFKPDDFSTIAFAGGGGGDNVTMTGGAGDDTAELRPGGGFIQGMTMVGAVLKPFRFEATESKLIVAQTGGGADSLILRGTAGDDTFYIRPGQFSAATADGMAMGRGFGVVNFEPGQGGSDSAVVYGTSGADQLTASVDGFSINGTDYQANIQGMRNLRVYAGQGQDSLTWNGGGESTNITASSSQISIRSGAFSGQFFGFERFTANKGLGEATATWLDSPLADVLAASPSVTRWSSPGFEFRTNNFNSVRAFAAGAQDAAVFVFPVGIAQFVTTADTARLTTATSVVEAFNFANVRGPADAPAAQSAAEAPNSAAARNSAAAGAALRLLLESQAGSTSLADAAFEDESDWLF